MSTRDEPLSIVFETTPNPRARKVIINRALREGPPATYRRASGAFDGGPLVKALLATAHVTDLYLRDTILTVTQDGTGSWYLLEDIIAGILRETIAAHDPAYAPPEPGTPASASAAPRPARKPSPQLDIIREILDATITPYISSHGGALDLIEFNTGTHRLTIGYEGACGTCPSSLGMTLGAIQNLLRDQYDPQITVGVASPG
jgi:Fe-S cluster biogenesis protein NfuA